VRQDNGDRSQTIQVQCSVEDQQLLPDELGHTPDWLTASCDDYQKVHSDRTRLITVEARTWNLGYYNKFPVEDKLCVTPVGCSATWILERELIIRRSVTGYPIVYYPGDEVSVACQYRDQQFVGREGEILPAQFTITCSDSATDPAWVINGASLPESSTCLYSEYALRSFISKTV